MLLGVLVGFGALAIDFGYARVVNAQLQHTADAAALAGATGLLGTRYVDPIATSRAFAHEFAAANTADNTPVDDLDLNVDNNPDGDIVTGVWDWDQRTFTPSVDPLETNAVLVRTARAVDRNTGVDTFLGRIFNVNELSVRDEAIAALGGPECESGFPLAVPDCGITDSNGDLICRDEAFRFSNDIIDNAGLTSLNNGSANVATFRDMIENYDPDAPCNVSGGDVISVNNGTPITAMRRAFENFLANGPRVVYIPILRTNSSSCEVRYNQTFEVAGFAAFELSNVGYAPDQYIEGRILCDEDDGRPSGSGFFGIAARPRLVK